MNIDIKLIASRGTLSTKEPFFVAQNENLTLLLETEYELYDFIVDIKNGEKQSKLRQKGKTIVIPDEFIKAGELQIVISKYVGGKLAKKWSVEPITMIEQDEGFEGYLVIEELSKRVGEIEQQTAEFLEYAKRIPILAEKLKDLTDLCNTNAKAVQQLVEIIKE